jgi:membrane-associated protease RseP (regulator of RpoE activity)
MKILLVLSFATGTMLVAQQTQQPALSPQMLFGAPVTGNPYAAEAVTETVQTLADGNRIVQRSSSMRYRDSQGRERREFSMNAGVGTGRQGVFISDPATRVMWTLNPVGHSAQRATMTVATPPAPTHGGAIGVMLMQNDHGTLQAKGLDHGALVGGTVPGSAAEQAGLLNGDIILSMDGQSVKDSADLISRGSAMTVGVSVALDIDRAGKAMTVHLTTRDRAQVFTGIQAWASSLPQGPQFQALLSNGLLPPKPDQSRIDDLGTQVLDGVRAQGARITTTIPSGQLGNERPIEMVNEAWYSSELQTTVLTKRSDPRTGETVFRLTGISRTEPDHSLFEVPADYSIAQQPVPTFVPRKPQ